MYGQIIALLMTALGEPVFESAQKEQNERPLPARSGRGRSPPAAMLRMALSHLDNSVDCGALSNPRGDPAEGKRASTPLPADFGKYLFVSHIWLKR
jgi:hypothetical protein